MAISFLLARSRFPTARTKNLQGNAGTKDIWSDEAQLFLRESKRAGPFGAIWRQPFRILFNYEKSGDKELESEGKVDKAKGDLHSAAGNVKDAARGLSNK
jgi:hypothetical protein